MKLSLRNVGCGMMAAGVLSLAVGCNSASTMDEGTTSEVATSAVSGALNNSPGVSGLATLTPAPKKSAIDFLLNTLNPISVAWAATFACTGGQLAPAFAGNGDYTYTPWSCSITWDNGKTASSEWSGTFNLAYSGCSASGNGSMVGQAAGCTRTRTTTAGGNTRTITGPKGNSYAIMHDTNGAGTGWDSTVSPAPSNGGVVQACGTGGCDSARTLTINGSHLTGTVTPAGGTAEKIWDHTLTTSAPLSVAVSSAGKVVNGTVTVEHNLAKYTANVTFNNVTYSEPGCCFPTSGTVSSLIDRETDGGSSSKTESITFSPICGNATLTNFSGQTSSITLQHCL